MATYRLPSKRKRSGDGHESLNLVPMVDSLFNVIFFLIITTTFLSIYEIKSPIPFVTDQEDENTKNKLNLLLEVSKTSLHLMDATNGKSIKTFPLDITAIDVGLNSLHQYLVDLKQSSPSEKTIILNPEADIEYGTIIQVMDTVRDLYKTDEPNYYQDAQGLEVASTELFSNILFGNINE